MRMAIGLGLCDYISTIHWGWIPDTIVVPFLIQPQPLSDGQGHTQCLPPTGMQVVIPSVEESPIQQESANSVHRCPTPQTDWTLAGGRTEFIEYRNSYAFYTHCCGCSGIIILFIRHHIIY